MSICAIYVELDADSQLYWVPSLDPDIMRSISYEGGTHSCLYIVFQWIAGRRG